MALTVNQFRLMLNGATGSVEVAFRINGVDYSPEKMLQIVTLDKGKLLIDLLTETIELDEEVEVKPEFTPEEVEDQIDDINVTPMEDMVKVRLGGRKKVKIIQSEI